VALSKRGVWDSGGKVFRVTEVGAEEEVAKRRGGVAYTIALEE